MPRFDKSNRGIKPHPTLDAKHDFSPCGGVRLVYRFRIVPDNSRSKEWGLAALRTKTPEYLLNLEPSISRQRCLKWLPY